MATLRKPNSPLSELDEAVASGASVDLYPAAVRARMASNPAGYGADRRAGGGGGGGAPSTEYTYAPEVPPAPRPAKRPDPQVSQPAARAVRDMQRQAGGGFFRDWRAVARDTSVGKAIGGAAGAGVPAVAADEPWLDPSDPAPKPLPKQDPAMARQADALRGQTRGYLDARRPLPTGVRRFDLGLETPSDVYVAVDANGNRVYTDDAQFAGRMSGGQPLTPQSLARGRGGDPAVNRATMARIQQNLEDPMGGLQYAGDLGIPVGAPATMAAQVRQGYGAAGDDAMERDLRTAFTDARRTQEIQDARAGRRPVDLRRRTEVQARAIADLQRNDPEGYARLVDDARADRALDLQAAQMQANLALRQQTAQDRAAALQIASRDRNLQQGLDLLQRMNARDADGNPLYDPRQLLAVASASFAEADPETVAELFRTPYGQAVRSLLDASLTDQAQAQGGYLSFLDDDVRVGVGDLRVDETGALYAREPRSMFDIQGQADFGRPRGLSRRLNIPEGALLGGMLQQQDYLYPEDDEP